MTFGEWIREKRNERNWSQLRLAREVGVHSGSVSYWENRHRLPKPGMIRKLIDVLGEPPADVLQGRILKPASRQVLPISDLRLRLLEKLPDFDPTWNADAQVTWLETFKRVFEYIARSDIDEGDKI